MSHPAPILWRAAGEEGRRASTPVRAGAHDG